MQSLKSCRGLALWKLASLIYWSQNNDALFEKLPDVFLVVWLYRNIFTCLNLSEVFINLFSFLLVWNAYNNLLHTCYRKIHYDKSALMKIYHHLYEITKPISYFSFIINTHTVQHNLHHNSISVTSINKATQRHIIITWSPVRHN